MPFKTYHSVAGNVAYKAMLSLLLPHPPRGSYTSNRLPLLPSLFRAGRYEIVWDLNVSKRDKIAVFFFSWPLILGLCRNFCTNYFWENLQISRTIWRMNFSKAGMNFSNSCVFRVRHHEPHFRSLNVLMRSMCRRKSACVVAKGEGQQGVQSEWVGTTCFRRLVQKDSCFEHDQVRHVLQSACKCSSADYR
jgi:hypothetical protein